ncbi:AAA family ATPase [Candidatus Sumerlaeota bacterium]|nr:AAA family ATPase [Candidatus Sumerlaeota bacterium]
MDFRDHQMQTIVGHDILKTLVQRFVQNDALPQALLFQGPPGIGKKSFAVATAKYINCKGEAGSGACSCSSCSRISRGVYLDVTILAPEGAARVIKIEKIRELQDSAFLTPIEARKKCYLIFDAERMSVSAANSLLKILEEPPRHLLIILTTTHPHEMLPTIRSRCMTFRFSTLPTEKIRNWLREIHNADQTVSEVASILSEGRLGLALEIAKGDFIKRRQELIKELDIFDQHGFAAVFRTAQNVRDLSPSLSAALDDLMIWYRDLLVDKLAADAPGLLMNEDQKEEIRRRSSVLTVNGLYEAFCSLMEKQYLGQRIMIEPLPMMVTLMDLGAALKKQ